jgi:hypothetical protein
MAKNRENIELQPDAWSRFERAIDVVAKSPPQHRVAKKPSQKKRATPKRVQKSS